MQMTDLMKRLAELDDKNPNVVSEAEGTVGCSNCGERFKIAGQKYGFSHCKDHAGKKPLDESVDLDECGPMEGMEDNKPDTRASINMSAGTGEEVASMLDAIMKLAGVKPVDGADMGVEHDPVVMTPEPTMAVGAAIGDRDDMRSVLDRLNSTDDGEIVDIDTDEAMYDNTPASPQPKKAFNSNEFAHQENQPGQGNRMDGTMPKATFEDTLMAEYKKFVAEDSVEDFLKAGGKITHVKPNKGPKRPGSTLGSRHIGGKNGTGKRSAMSGSRANIGKNYKPVVAVEGDDTDHKINESLSPGEYHLWTVHFDDGTTGKIRITWDETSDEDIKAHYAKKGKTVVKIDYDWAVHGGENPPVTPEPYEKEKPRNPYATRTGPDTAFK